MNQKIEQELVRNIITFQDGDEFTTDFGGVGRTLILTAGSSPLSKVTYYRDFSYVDDEDREEAKEQLLIHYWGLDKVCLS